MRSKIFLTSIYFKRKAVFSTKLVFNKILCVHPFLKKIFYYIMGKKA